MLALDCDFATRWSAEMEKCYCFWILGVWRWRETSLRCFGLQLKRSGIRGSIEQHERGYAHDHLHVNVLRHLWNLPETHLHEHAHDCSHSSSLENHIARGSPLRYFLAPLWSQTLQSFPDEYCSRSHVNFSHSGCSESWLPQCFHQVWSSLVTNCWNR